MHGMRIRGGVARGADGWRAFLHVQYDVRDSDGTEYSDGERFATEEEAREHYRSKILPIIGHLEEMGRRMGMEIEKLMSSSDSES
jgi:hypothetical protein